MQKYATDKEDRTKERKERMGKKDEEPFMEFVDVKVICSQVPLT